MAGIGVAGEEGTGREWRGPEWIGRSGTAWNGPARRGVAGNAEYPPEGRLYRTALAHHLKDEGPVW